ncbi:DUF2515 family protein [Limnobacter sp.]|uniref:DUF2515 family protein n=1 Tax=Limnobacter sp. TaxID=2003368 RepID=UPI00351459F6
MSRCFYTHGVDFLPLHTSRQPLGECHSYLTERHGEPKLIAEVEVLTCSCLWRVYQKEAQALIAPGEQWMVDPVARNRKINSAYAALWRYDKRFEWAGLAAFASKQVGCGMLHAAQGIQTINERQRKLGDISRRPLPPSGRVAVDAAQAALEATEQSIQFVHEALALGNSALFLDIYPLHMFYAKRGLDELKKCIKARQRIYANPEHPVVWPVQDKVTFGIDHPEIIPAFEAIERGDIFDGVGLLARHEQQNILQPVIYDDWRMRSLLQGNQGASALAHVTGISTGLEQPVQLTLANQCGPIHDGRSIEFSKNAFADLANLDERMAFVMRAARQFHQLLRSPERGAIEKEILQIAEGHPVR